MPSRLVSLTPFWLALWALWASSIRRCVLKQDAASYCCQREYEKRERCNNCSPSAALAWPLLGSTGNPTSSSSRLCRRRRPRQTDNWEYLGASRICTYTMYTKYSAQASARCVLEVWLADTPTETWGNVCVRLFFIHPLYAALSRWNMSVRVCVRKRDSASSLPRQRAPSATTWRHPEPRQQQRKKKKEKKKRVRTG